MDTIHPNLSMAIKEFGFDLYEVADPDHYAFENAPIGHRPQDYLPNVKSVIVLGLEVIDSILQTTPSGSYGKHYDTLNVMLDIGAYKLTKWLQKRGHKSIYFTETTSYPILWEQYEMGFSVFVPAFNHMAAAVAAGLGTMGTSGVVLTPEYGPRQRWITVLTEEPLATRFSFEVDLKNLCLEIIKTGSCQKCINACPVQAIRPDLGTNVRKCFRHWTLLRKEGRACGLCIKVCPIGR